MGFLSRMREKAQGAAGKHSGKVKQGIDSASQKVDERTGGKYSDKIQKGTEKAKGYVEEQGSQGGGQEEIGRAHV